MARDFYCAFPYDLPALPCIRRLRREPGGLGVLLAYYELRMAVGQGYQYGQHVTVEDALAMGPDWGMDDAGVSDALGRMAGLGLIDAEMLGEGVVAMEDVAARQQYIMKRAEAGRAGNEKRWGKKTGKPGGDVGENQTESLD